MSDLALTRILLLRLAGEARERLLMDRGRSTHQSNKSVFPTHINLNLQALPGKRYYREFIRLSLFKSR